MTHGRRARSWRIAGWTAAAFAAVAYALLAHHAASAPHPGLFEVSVILVPLMAIMLPLAWRSQHRLAWLSLWLVVAVGLFLARGQLAAGTQWMLLAQHVGINLGLGLAFGRTLAAGAKPLISRFAEVVHGALSARQARYTRRATLAWTAFFGLMVAISLFLFALAPIAVWSAFVNLLSLPLVIVMFAGEYLARVVSLPRAERAGFFEAVGAYRRVAGGNAKPH